MDLFSLFDDFCLSHFKGISQIYPIDANCQSVMVSQQSVVAFMIASLGKEEGCPGHQNDVSIAVLLSVHLAIQCNSLY
jgi:hypothetical protein